MEGLCCPADCDRASEVSFCLEDEAPEAALEPGEAQELADSLKEIIQSENVKPKLQCIMSNPNFSMVTVQCEDSGIIWETTSSRCSTPWASEASTTSDVFSMESSSVGSPPGKVIFIMDENKLRRRKVCKSSDRTLFPSHLREGFGQKKHETFKSKIAESASSPENVNPKSVSDGDSIADEKFSKSLGTPDFNHNLEEIIDQAPAVAVPASMEATSQKPKQYPKGSLNSKIQKFNVAPEPPKAAPRTLHRTEGNEPGAPPATKEVLPDTEQSLDKPQKSPDQLVLQEDHTNNHILQPHGDKLSAKSNPHSLHLREQTNITESQPALHVKDASVSEQSESKPTLGSLHSGLTPASQSDYNKGMRMPSDFVSNEFSDGVISTPFPDTNGNHIYPCIARIPTGQEVEYSRKTKDQGKMPEGVMKELRLGQHLMPGEATEEAEEVGAESNVFSIVSEGYEILNIIAPLNISSVDQEESEHMQDKLQYLEDNPSFKAKHFTDTNHNEVGGDSGANANVNAKVGMAEENVNMVRHSENAGKTEKGTLAEEENNFPNFDEAKNVSDMDYFEKYTLVDDNIPVPPEIQIPLRGDEVDNFLYGRASKLSKQSYSIDEEFNANSLEEDFYSPITDIDQAFYGSTQEDDKALPHSRGSLNLLSAQNSFDRGYKSDINVDPNESDSAETHLFNTEERVLTRSMLFPTTVQLVNPELLEEPPALAFMYKDLYEQAVGDRTKEDSEHSDTESVNSDHSFPTRNSDTDDGPGIYFEKYILKDEIELDVGGSQKGSKDHYENYYARQMHDIHIESKAWPQTVSEDAKGLHSQHKGQMPRIQDKAPERMHDRSDTHVLEEKMDIVMANEAHANVTSEIMAGEATEVSDDLENTACEVIQSNDNIEIMAGDVTQSNDTRLILTSEATLLEDSSKITTDVVTQSDYAKLVKAGVSESNEISQVSADEVTQLNDDSEITIEEVAESNDASQIVSDEKLNDVDNILAGDVSLSTFHDAIHSDKAIETTTDEITLSNDGNKIKIDEIIQSNVVDEIIADEVSQPNDGSEMFACEVSQADDISENIPSMIAVGEITEPDDVDESLVKKITHSEDGSEMLAHAAIQAYDNSVNICSDINQSIVSTEKGACGESHIAPCKDDDVVSMPVTLSEDKEVAIEKELAVEKLKMTDSAEEATFPLSIFKDSSPVENDLEPEEQEETDRAAPHQAHETVPALMLIEPSVDENIFAQTPVEAAEDVRLESKLSETLEKEINGESNNLPLLVIEEPLEESISEGLDNRLEGIVEEMVIEKESFVKEDDVTIEADSESCIEPQFYDASEGTPTLTQTQEEILNIDEAIDAETVVAMKTDKAEATEITTAAEMAYDLVEVMAGLENSEMLPQETCDEQDSQSRRPAVDDFLSQSKTQYQSHDEETAESMDYEVITHEELMQDEIFSEGAQEELMLLVDKEFSDHVSDSGYEFVHDLDQDLPVDHEDSGFEMIEHEKLPAESEQKISESENENLQKEPKAPQIDTYCYACRCPIYAIDKLFGEHENHEVTTLDDAIIEMTGHLEEVLEKLQESSIKTEEFVTEIESLYNAVEGNYNTNEKLLEEQNEEMVKMVEDQHNEKMQSFEEVKKRKMEYLYDQMLSFQQSIDMARDVLEKTVKETEDLEPVLFLSSAKEINNRDKRCLCLKDNRVEQLNHANNVRWSRRKISRLLLALDNTISLEKMPSAFSLFEHYAENSLRSDQKMLKHIPVPHTPKLKTQEPNTATGTSITAYWSISEDDVIDCFQVYCMEEPQGNREQSGLIEEYRVTVKESYCILEELEPDKCYNVWVMAVNYTGCSLPSEKCTFRTAPSTPAIKAEECTVCWDTAIIRWSTAYPDPNGSFTLECCKQYSPEGEGLRSIAGIKSYELTINLNPNENYFFYVKAVNNFGSSEQSEAALISTKGTRFHLLRDTVQPPLQLTPDGSTMSVTEDYADSGIPSVLGELLPARGQHYWEVTVADCAAFRIGVCYKSTPPKSVLAQNNTSWCMYCYSTATSFQYQFLHDDVVRDVILTDHPVRLGVLLDNNGERLLFFNADLGQLLFTIRHRFTEALHPAFALEAPGNMHLRTGIELPAFTKHR